MTALPAVTEASFAAAVAGPGLVFVLFTAAWCPPCVQVAPEVAGLASDLGKDAAVVVADIDAVQRTAAGLELDGRPVVRGVPSLVAFRAGVPVAAKLGFARRAALRDWARGVMDSEARENGHG